MSKTTHFTEKQAEQTPAGGVLIGKRDGQTIIHNKGTMGGYLVGRLHKDDGIKAVNLSNGQPLEMQGAEVVITAPAVADQTLHEFDGKKMNNREILNEINVSGGGVSFADGGEIPESIAVTGRPYMYDGKRLSDYRIVHKCGCKHSFEAGGGFDHKSLMTGYRIERDEHSGTFKKLYRKEITPNEAAKEVAADHLSENSKYYEKYAGGGRMFDPMMYSGGGVIKSIRKYSSPTLSDKRYNFVENRYEYGYMVELEDGRKWFGYAVDRADAKEQAKKEFGITGGKLKLSDIPESVKTFMPEFQQKAIVGSEEHWEVIERLEDIIKRMPETYGTENQKADDKIVYLHYFYGQSDWYIVEKDKEEEQLQAYGYAILNGDTEMAEWGYISIEELKSIGPDFSKRRLSGIELDFYFEPIRFGDLKKQWQEEEEQISEAKTEEIVKSEITDYLFIGNYPNSTVYSDKTIEDKNTRDYHQIARVVYSPLDFKVYDNNPKYKDALNIASEEYQKLYEKKFGINPFTHRGENVPIDVMRKEADVKNSKQPEVNTGKFFYGKTLNYNQDRSVMLKDALANRGFIFVEETPTKLTTGIVGIESTPNFMINIHDNNGEFRLADASNDELLAYLDYDDKNGPVAPNKLADKISAAYEQYKHLKQKEAEVRRQSLSGLTKGDRNYVLPDKPKDIKLVQSPEFEYKGFRIKRNMMSHTQGLWDVYDNGVKIGSYDIQVSAISGDYKNDGRENMFVKTDFEIMNIIDDLISEGAHENSLKKAYAKGISDKPEVKIVSEEVFIPNQTEEDENDIDETYDTERGAKLKHIFQQNYESGLNFKQLYHISSINWDFQDVHIKFDNKAEGNIDFSRAAIIHSYNPPVHDELKAMSATVLALADNKEPESTEVKDIDIKPFQGKGIVPSLGVKAFVPDDNGNVIQYLQNKPSNHIIGISTATERTKFKNSHQAAVAEGYNVMPYSAGKYGNVYVYEKKGRAMTKKYFDSLAKDIEILPEENELPSAKPEPKFKVGDKVRLKEQYLKKEPVMQRFNEATITKPAVYIETEKRYMYDTVKSQDNGPQYFYEDEIELIEPVKENIEQPKEEKYWETVYGRIAGIYSVYTIDDSRKKDVLKVIYNATQYKFDLNIGGVSRGKDFYKTEKEEMLNWLRGALTGMSGVEPTNQQIADRLHFQYGTDLIKQLIADNPAPAPVVKAAEVSLMQQYKNAAQPVINKVIRELIAKKGPDRDAYSADELSFLRLYEGGGAEKKEASDKSILTQFFTPEDIVARMWGLAIKHGFTFSGTSILEPSFGSGRFFKYIPKDADVKVVGYEIEHTAYQICQILYGSVDKRFDLRLQSFETLFFKMRRHVGMAGVSQLFDLVITNPPYGEYSSEYAPLGERNATGAYTWEMYFIMRGVDLLKKGGLLVYIIPNSFMNNDKKYNDFKEKLAEKCDLIDGYRLPNGVFSHTDVGTDIIVLRKK